MSVGWNRPATALQHLHTNGLVHRDVKPSNIIFVSGVAKLADIGLVTGADMTRSHVGTEGFAAPEGPGTLQADLYSLGKVLYEISTGKDRQQFPELPTDLRDFPERERLVQLNTVIARACRHNPDDRYTSAAEMHADLKIIQGGGSLPRMRKWRLAPVMVGTMAVLAVAAALFGGQRYRGKEGQAEKIPEDSPVRLKAVQWSVEEGGNGHWYEPVPITEGLSWEEANADAQAKGGYLVDIHSIEENAFVFKLIDAPEYWTRSKNDDLIWTDGPWIGAFQKDLSSEPAANFVWSRDASPLVFANWLPSQPDNDKRVEHHVKFFGLGSHKRSSAWNDSPGWTRSAYVIEYDSDPRAVENSAAKPSK